MKWVIGIYLDKFTNNEPEISISHEAAECGVKNFEFIVNADSSQAMTTLTFLLFKLNKLQNGVMTVVCWIYTTAITLR